MDRLHKLSRANCDSMEKLCAELARVFDVRGDEVALLRVQGNLLKFVFPPELQTLGAIPLSSSAVAARTATTRKAELFNSFVKVKHESVFETVKLGSAPAAAPQARVIQKLMSAPIVDERNQVLGVIQVSRKGAILAAAGPDFTPDDLRTLESAGRLVPGLGVLGTATQPTKAAAPRPEERRAFPRWPVKLSVQYGHAPDFELGEATDISEGGIGFTGKKTYAVGAEIEVRFFLDLPGAKWFESKALVRRADRGTFGVEFVGMAPSERGRLREALRAYSARRSA